ncbi:MAG: pantothenate kinase [Acidiferrobacteraceae bacterium]|nr:pantothenate kinase [Acidiferrobacteraceae bacterium]
MLLLIDIGNTNITVAISNDKRLLDDWRIATSRYTTSDELWLVLCMLLNNNGYSPATITGAALSSVVPNLTSTVESLLIDRLEVPVINISTELDLGIVIDYENPESVGADRICNAVAGYQKYGGPLIVVDFGTATTFDIISSDGTYLGGIIAPGPETSVASLHLAAAKLPAVELRFPETLVGRTTESSMQSGVMHGSVAMIDGINRQLIGELGGTTSIVATGGLSSLFASELETVDIWEPTLTLDGLRLIFDRCVDLR